MATYRITVTNQTFQSCDSYDLPSAQEAGKQGIDAALAIGSEEISQGKPFFGAEVRVEDGDETVARFVVSVGVSPIQ